MEDYGSEPIDFLELDSVIVRNKSSVYEALVDFAKSKGMLSKSTVDHYGVSPDNYIPLRIFSKMDTELGRAAAATTIPAPDQFGHGFGFQNPKPRPDSASSTPFRAPRRNNGRRSSSTNFVMAARHDRRQPRARTSTGLHSRSPSGCRCRLLRRWRA